MCDRFVDLAHCHWPFLLPPESWPGPAVRTLALGVDTKCTGPACAAVLLPRATTLTARGGVYTRRGIDDNCLMSTNCGSSGSMTDITRNESCEIQTTSKYPVIRENFGSAL